MIIDKNTKQVIFENVGFKRICKRGGSKRY